MSDNTINFDEAKKRCSMTRKGFSTSYKYKKYTRQVRACGHEVLILDEESMLCECHDCGELIHPFYILLEYAERERSTRSEWERLQRAIAEFKKIKAEWSLSEREKRRIEKAGEYKPGVLWKE